MNLRWTFLILATSLMLDGVVSMPTKKRKNSTPSDDESDSDSGQPSNPPPPPAASTSSHGGTGNFRASSSQIRGASSQAILPAIPDGAGGYHMQQGQGHYAPQAGDHGEHGTEVQTQKFAARLEPNPYSPESNARVRSITNSRANAQFFPGPPNISKGGTTRKALAGEQTQFHPTVAPYTSAIAGRNTEVTMTMDNAVRDRGHDGYHAATERMVQENTGTINPGDRTPRLSKEDRRHWRAGLPTPMRPFAPETPLHQRTPQPSSHLTPGGPQTPTPFASGSGHHRSGSASSSGSSSSSLPQLPQIPHGGFHTPARPTGDPRLGHNAPFAPRHADTLPAHMPESPSARYPSTSTHHRSSTLGPPPPSFLGPPRPAQQLHPSQLHPSHPLHPSQQLHPSHPLHPSHQMTPSGSGQPFVGGFNPNLGPSHLPQRHATLPPHLPSHLQQPPHPFGLPAHLQQPPHPFGHPQQQHHQQQPHFQQPHHQQPQHHRQPHHQQPFRPPTPPSRSGSPHPFIPRPPSPGPHRG